MPNDWPSAISIPITLPTNVHLSILLGVAVGDALGVPVEFTSRESLMVHPVMHMRGYGTHTVPAGTFSDDASLTLCLAENLTGVYSLEAIAQNMVKWYYQNYWTAHGQVFDVGIATQKAIQQLYKGVPPTL